MLGSEQYGSRLCMTIDVCSERQVQLILEVDDKAYLILATMIAVCVDG